MKRQTIDGNSHQSFVFVLQPTQYVAITTRRGSDTTDCADVECVHLKKIVGQLKNNLYNVSVLSEPDLEMITNMDPNLVADITGKDFIEQLKEVSGRLDDTGIGIVFSLMSKQRLETKTKYDYLSCKFVFIFGANESEQHGNEIQYKAQRKNRLSPITYSLSISLFRSSSACKRLTF